MSDGGSPTVRILTKIWEKALHRSPIEVQDRFLDLGGNPAAARQIFLEIADALGKTLPPEMIYQAPTIAALARQLEQPGEQLLQPLVLLKPGAGELPLFLAHGMGGTVMEFFELVNFIHLPHPIYGMQAKGNDGIEKPFDRIEDLAQNYLEAIRSVQLHGPYFLAGYSLGGLVMLEVARQLSARDEKIGLLVMIDSYPHRDHLDLRQRLSPTARRVAEFPGSIRAAAGPSELRSTQHLSPVRKRAYESAYSAWRFYKPRFYGGKINFIRAGIPTIYPSDPAKVWARVTSEIEIETVPGDHHEMLTTHFENLAGILCRYFNLALQGLQE